MKNRFVAVAALVLGLSCLAPMAGAAPSQKSGLAYVSTQPVEIDGQQVEFQMYALKDINGYDTNYVKLRDVAHALNGTAAQFQVGWNGAVIVEKGQSYTPNGSEMFTPYSGDRTYTRPEALTYIDTFPYDFDAILLRDDQGGGYTYYKLRDLGNALDFLVDWSAERGVFIETTGPEGLSDEEIAVEDETPQEQFEEPPEDPPFSQCSYVILEANTLSTWTQALDYCARQGGQLAVISSQAENDYIRALMQDAEVSAAFVGLSNVGGTWGWCNGAALNYTNWAPNEPDASGTEELYGVLHATGQWSTGRFPDATGGSALFICEWYEQ